MEKEQNLSDKENLSEDEKNKNVSDEVVSHNMDQKSQEKNSEEKISELEDKIARTLAEMENQRRRFEKEKEEAFEYGGFAFAKEALNLIDNLERSKQILTNDEAIKNSEALKKTLEHLDIINKDLISIFAKNNIKPIECLKKKLDPNFHQAMMEIEDNEKEAGTIIQEIQKGFTIKERLLRPSLVGVSKKAGNLENNKENKENEQNLENK